MTARTLPNPFEYLRRNAERDPNGVFSRSPDAVMTNREALETAVRLAFELRRMGVVPGQSVALDLPDQLSLVFTEALFHEACTGLVLPPAYPVEGGFRADWAFTSRRDAALAADRIVHVDRAFLQHVEENPGGIRPREEPLEVLRIVFSSGTTGRPKAIALRRTTELLFEAALDRYFLPGTLLCLFDIATPAGIGDFYLSVRTGRPFLVAGQTDPDALVRFVEQQHVAVLRGSPAQVAAIVDVLERTSRTLPSVTTVRTSGTSVSRRLAGRITAVLPGASIRSAYGSTEAGSATERPIDSVDPYDLGHPAWGAEVEVVDDQDVALAAGLEGRVRYRAPGMVQQYLGDDEATGRAFRDGWFYPGDRAIRRDDGGFTLVGRETDLLNAGGVKIDAARVEAVAEEHPGVREAAAFRFAQADGLDAIGLAYVSDAQIDTDALVIALGEALGRATPTLVARVETIPRTMTGKPLRRELSARFDESAAG